MTLPHAENRSDADAVIEAALTAAAPTEVQPGTVYDTITPNGATRSLVDTESLLPAPRRLRGTTTLHEIVSLTEWANQFDAKSVYADEPKRTVTAIVNDNLPDGPGWGDHRAHCTLAHTPEWKAWAGRSGVLGSQLELAELIEERVIDIVEPDGATMLELAQSFEASSSASFRSGQRLSSGERQFLYDETVEAKAGRRGELTVPERFTLRLAVFVGEDPVEVSARLRYRVGGGQLRIGYAIERLTDVVHDAFEAATEALDAQLTTGAVIYRGEAPAARR